MLNSRILEICLSILESKKESSFLRGGEFTSVDGHYHCDCSSYINSILKILDIGLYKDCLGTRQRMKAIDYFELCTSNHKRVRSHREISKLIPGEIIVWKKNNPPKSGDTGHMAIILEAPVEVEPGKWKVLVSDSSKTLHDNDSRTGPGVGSGELFLLEKDNLIIGYIWSTKITKNKLSDVLCMSFL